jgi:photosystem II stability/assembly factor-like uncharacterized protein
MWFVSLQMVSPTSGWALRWATDPADPSGAPVLAPSRTSDGGRTWGDVTPPQAHPLLSPLDTYGTLYALDEKDAWFAVSLTRSGRQPHTTVFSTVDGGRNWASASFASLGTPRFLDFVDARHGWLLTDLGAEMGNNVVAIFATSGGGRRWSLASRTIGWKAFESPTGRLPRSRPGELPVYGDKTGMTFASPTTGWVTMDLVAGTHNLEVSHDDGRTWAAQLLPSRVAMRLSAGGDGSEAVAPQFFGRHGFLVLYVGPKKPFLLRSSDGGTIWTRATLPAGAGGYPVVWFVDARQGFLLEGGTSGSLGAHFYRTSDAGHTWTRVPTALRFSQLERPSFDFVSPKVVFAWTTGDDEPGASPPPLYETSDGGRTWQRIVPEVSN